MKKIFFLFLILLLPIVTNAQTITIDNQGYTAQQLVDEVLVISCTPITNVNASGDATVKSYGYFSRNAGSTFPFEEGIYLTTGSSNQITDVNYGSGIAAPTMSYGTTAWGSDSDLETALGTTNMTNATVLEFDFIPTVSNISFDYLMLSEEYHDEYPCNYADGFAFLIKPVGAAVYQNIAVIPTTTTPVAVTTVHSDLTDAGVALSCGASNAAYFDSYYALDTNFNGRTTVFTASTAVTAGEQYHIKLVVADATGTANPDTSFDTAIFLKARGLNLGAVNVDIGPDIAICQGDPDPILDATVPNANAQYQWQVFDTNTNTYVDIAGETNPTYTVTTTGLYQVILNVDGCLSDDHALVTISQVPIANQPNDLEICDTDGVIDGITTIDLTTQNTAILNGQDSNIFTVNYYTDAALTTQINNPSSYVNTTAYQQTIYAQVVNNTNTSCQSNTISFDVLIYDAPNPLALPNLVVCDINGNGIATFDLTIQNTALLNGQDAGNYTINYYQDEALTILIPDPANYTNTSSPNQQTIYVSIENTAHPMCNSTLNFDLIISNDLDVGQPPKLRECDDDGDGFWIFDLTVQDDIIMAGLDPALYTLTYYEDAALTNPIVNPATHQNDPIYLQTIYAQVVNNANPDCNAIVQFDIEVFIIPDVTNPPDLSACDTDNDGFTVFDLTQNDSAVLNGQDPATHIVLYYTDAALTQQIPNPATYTNTVAYTETIYVIAANTELPTCQSVGTSFDLNVYDVPQPIPPLDNLFSCDFAANGIATFDLTSQETTILNGQNAANYTINYYEDAALTTLIATPNNYDNTTPNLQTIYVEVVNNANSTCSTTAQFDLIINNTPTIIQPDPLRICDDNNDGFWTFDLTSQETTILNGLSNVDYNISYYTDAAMTQLIATPNNYTNIIAYNQTIYIKVVNNTFSDCQNNTTLSLEVADTPTATQPPNMETCDNDNTTGVGIGVFDLTSQDTSILNGQSTATFTVSYYTNPSHSALITTPNAYQNNTSGAIQTIYAQVVNNSNDTCTAETTFTLQTFDTPQPPAVIPPFQNCDDDNDGIQTVNLTDFDTVLLNGHSAADLQINYFLDAALTNPVATPTTFTNTTAYTQQLYATITNVLYTACTTTVAFDVKIYNTPQAFTPDDVYLCNDGRSASFDMSVQIPDILNGQSNMLVSFYGSQDDADNSDNPLANPFIATVNAGPFTVFVRVEDQGYNACADTSVTFTIEAFEAPQPPTTLTPVEVCDDNNDGFFTFDLPALKDTEILNGQNAADFTIRYYTDAALTNEIPNPNTFTNTTATTQRIWIKMTNNNYNGCDETRFFDLKIYDTPSATQPINMQQCDNDTTVGVGSSIFDLTSQNITILNGQDPAVFAVHFYTDTALTNEILNPNNYNNTTGANAETIYVQVVNTLYNVCTATTDFTIQTFDSPQPPTTLTPVEVCDDNNDGFFTFDLPTLKDTEILNGQNTADFTIRYYTDAALTNEILAPSTFTNTTATTQRIWIKMTNNNYNGCDETRFFDLKIYDTPSATQPINMQQCDNDTTVGVGSSIFDLTSQNIAILNGQDPAVFAVHFYTDTALTNEILNPNNYNNTTGANAETIYVQVVNTLYNVCTATTDFTIQTFDSPQPPTTLTPVEVCDDNNDGFFTFDLPALKDTEILNGQNAADFTIRYYTDAALTNEIPNPNTFTNTTATTQRIWIKMTNNNYNSCAETRFFDLKIYDTPSATQPINMQQCDNDTTVGVGSSIFDLTSQNIAILNGQDPAVFAVHFYTDAALTNEILNPNNYNNTTGANAETIYVQVLNTLYNVCTATTDFTIQTFDSPSLPATITPLAYCDNNTDGVHITNLTQKALEILNGYASVDFTIHYYTNATLTNEIGSPNSYTNTTPYTETIYIKVLNNLFNNCEAIGSFELIINPIPTVTNYSDSICDTDGVYDNYTTIDLTQYQNSLTNDTTIVNFYYYTDAAHTNQIASPTSFTNTQFTQTIYIQVENSTTLCIANTELTITVSAANAEDTTLSQCDDLTEDGITVFDLSQADNVILANMSPFVGVTLQKYLNYDDALNQTNEYTASTYTNTTNPQTIYARVTNNTNPNCFDIATITLEVYSLPDILLEDTYYLCLDQGSVTVDATTNFVTYRWYDSLGFLLGNTQFHTFTNAGAYYLIATNANGCSKRDDFTVEISESPEIIDVLVVDLAADNTLTVTAIGAITGDPAAAAHFEYALDNGPYQSATTFHNVHGGWRLLRVRDINGCGEVTQRVMVLDYPKFFTPNGDGYNDTWHLFGHEFVDGIEVYIYDRHDKLLKIIYQYDLGWDGEYNGNPIPATDYWFRLQLRDGRTFRSHFSLIR